MVIGKCNTLTLMTAHLIWSTIKTMHDQKNNTAINCFDSKYRPFIMVASPVWILPFIVFAVNFQIIYCCCCYCCCTACLWTGKWCHLNKFILLVHTGSWFHYSSVNIRQDLSSFILYIGADNYCVLVLATLWVKKLD